MKTGNPLGLFLSMLVFLAACSGNSTKSTTDQAAADSVVQEATLPLQIVKERDALDGIIDPEATAVIIGSGYAWTEGPLWIASEGMLLFSEIPANKVHSWKEGKAPQVYLDPAGFTGEGSRGGELGSNGLLLDPQGNLVLCQHGDRRMARMRAPLDQPESNFETIVGEYEGMPFNSPNDAVYDAEGNLYFTDPPYGLESRMDDPAKAIPFQGVYRYSKDGELDLLLDSISRPNGLAFLADGKELLIANSDPEKPYWYRYSLDDNGIPAEGQIYHDASEVFESNPGLPDGLKVRRDGTVFATGPGGIWIFDAEGQVLGRLNLGELCSNVALNEKEDLLFVTADSYVVRIALK